MASLTGGAISMLYHRQAGPLMAGSLAVYRRVEPKNMQVPPYPEDYPLTPRVERVVNGQLFSTLYDLTAKVQAEDKGGVIHLPWTANCARPPARAAADGCTWTTGSRQLARISAAAPEDARLVLPLIALPSDTVRRTSPGAITIPKPLAVPSMSAPPAAWNCGTKAVRASSIWYPAFWPSPSLAP